MQIGTSIPVASDAAPAAAAAATYAASTTSAPVLAVTDSSQCEGTFLARQIDTSNWTVRKDRLTSIQYNPATKTILLDGVKNKSKAKKYSSSSLRFLSSGSTLLGSTGTFHDPTDTASDVSSSIVSDNDRNNNNNLLLSNSSTMQPVECAARLARERLSSPTCIRKRRVRDSITINRLQVTKMNLVGRDEHIQLLTDHFRDVTAREDQPPSMVMIQGVSGTGKSALAQELRRRFPPNMLFCFGKYELHDLDGPHTAFVDALQELKGQILARGSVFGNSLRQKIKESLGEESIAVLTNLIPNLQSIYGDNDKEHTNTHFRPQGEEPASNRNNQIIFVLRNFIKCISSKEHPLVMVLDDIQWADPSSLFFMESLVTDVENSSFLLVATCRSNEVSEGHPVAFMQQSVKRQNTVVLDILLDGLNATETQVIINTALRLDQEDVSTNQLADLIYHKTGGNPLFVLRFLQSLVDDDMVSYDFSSMRFVWNLEGIMKMNVTDNVADLIAAKFDKLGKEKQTTLQVAACLTQSFKLDALAFVINGLRLEKQFKHFVWPTNLSQVIASLVQDGVLETRNARVVDDCYSFVHDQIHAAAYRLIPLEQQAPLQLAVGMRLIQGMDRGNLDKYLFLAIDLCNKGIHLLQDTEAMSYAVWNLMAGDMALKRAAWTAALRYMEVGIKCLGPSGWQTKPQVALSLHCGAVEAAYCSGDMKLMEEYATTVIRRSEFSTLEKIRVYYTYLPGLGVQERFKEGVETGRRILREIGVANLSRSPSLFNLLFNLLKTQRLLKGRDAEFLLNLPTCSDQAHAVGMGVIHQLSTMSYQTSPYLFLIMMLKVFQWTIKYGVSRYSPMAIGAYSMMCTTILKDSKQGIMYGETALALAEKRHLKSQRACLYHAIFGYIHHWMNPLQASFVPLAYGNQLAMETGEVEIAFYCFASRDTVALLTASMPLEELVQDIEMHCTLMCQYKQQAIKTQLATPWQVCLNLIGPCTDPLILVGKAMTEDNTRMIAKKNNNRFLEVLMDYWRFQLAYLFGKYEEAGRIADTTMDLGIKVGHGSHHVPRHTFMVGMVAAALVKHSKLAKARKKRRKIASLMLKRLKGWVGGGNGNCLHTMSLLEAELCAADGHRDLAEDKFKKAIVSATRSGFLHDKALAHERAAVFFSDFDGESGRFWASYHLNNAITCYQDWGAWEKVNDLKLRYGFMLVKDKSISDEYP